MQHHLLNQDEGQNKKDYKNQSIISSKELKGQDPKISTFDTFCTISNNPQTRVRCRATQKKKNWNMSATTLTRDESPSYLIPKSLRFRSLKQDLMKNGKFASLDLRTQLNQGVSFPKSKRRDHFIKKQNFLFPSSASYHKDEFSPKGSRALKVASFNPDLEERIHYINHSLNAFKSTKKKSSGITIGKFKQIEAKYQHHGRHMPYQPETSKSNPGVGTYTPTNSEKQRNPSYSMRSVLIRFNEAQELIPGPGKYEHEEVRPHSVASINQKGTFQQSRRIFLANPNNQTPGPGAYMKK